MSIMITIVLIIMSIMLTNIISIIISEVGRSFQMSGSCFQVQLFLEFPTTHEIFKCSVVVFFFSRNLAKFLEFFKFSFELCNFGVNNSVAT